MARIFTEDFEGGAHAAAVTTSNTNFVSVLSGATFTDASLVGNLAMRTPYASGATNPMGYVRTDSTQTLFMRAYVARDSAVQFFPMRVIQESPLALRTILVVTPTGQVRALDPSYGSVTQNSTVTIPLGEYARIEWGVTATTQQVRLFVGNNVHGTVPDYDSGPASWTLAGPFNMPQFGNVNSAVDADMRIDEIAVDDSTWPGPADTEEPTTTPWRVLTEQGWTPMALHTL